MKKWIVLTAGLLALTACQGLTSSKKPTALYNLRYTGAEIASMDMAGIMVVGEPMLPSGMETDRIALHLDNGRRLDYYADAAWAESLEDVLQDVVVQAGRSALPNMLVDTPRLNVPANYRLTTKVLDFMPVYRATPAETPALKVAVNFTLVHLPEKRVVTDFMLENGQMAADNSMPAIAGGLEGLMNGVLSAAFEKIAAATAAFEQANPDR